MRYLPIGKLVPGMALGQDVYDGEGRLLLARHLLLTTEYISNLELFGFPGIYIDDEFTQGIEIQQILNPQVKCRALKMIHDLFSIRPEEAKTDELEKKLQETIEKIVENILSNGDVMCNVLDIKNYDGYIYYHSINVCMLASMIGVSYGLSEKQLEDLATAALLHDVGKRFLSRELWNIDRKLTEEEEKEIRQHARMGADFLRDHFHFSSTVHSGILQHHENFDGTGYPLQRKGEEIPLYARIIRLVDCYDNLTSRQLGRAAYSPSDAVEFLMSESGRTIDPQLLDIFLGKIAVYPVGCEVVLSDGRHAVVMQNFDHFLLRPRVKLLETGEVLDLKEDAACRNITIEDIIF